VIQPHYPPNPAPIPSSADLTPDATIDTVNETTAVLKIKNLGVPAAETSQIAYVIVLGDIDSSSSDKTLSLDIISSFLITTKKITFTFNGTTITSTKDEFLKPDNQIIDYGASHLHSNGSKV
jgi:hypothetical protein